MTSNSLPIDITVPGYRLDRQVGSDAIGLWFDAEQESLGRKVTVKVLKPDLCDVARAREEFLAELDRLTSLVHPNVIQVLDSTRDATLAIVTDRTGHQTLFMQLAAGKPLTRDLALRHARDVARALHYLAGQGLAHKNVTPRLVAFREDGGCRLVTFRYVIPLEEQAALKGRLAQDPDYVAPEQIAGEEPVGPTTPCYHAGALLYHMLAGRPPHRGVDVKEIARAHLEKDFPSLKRLQPFLDRAVYDLVAACTLRAPSQRPPLDDVAAGLDALARGEDPGIRPPADGDALTLRSRRRRRRRRR